MAGRWLGLVTRACIAGILVGIVCMIQPFVFALFAWGFFLLLASTVVYTVVSHLPERSRAAADTSVTEEVPIALGAGDETLP